MLAAAHTSPLQDDRFVLLDLLGRGGMGSVYSAFDRLERRLVALKVLAESRRPGPSHPLAEEFDTWSRLRHPNIVEAYEMRLAGSGPLTLGTPYLVLEHVAGGPAHRILPPGRAAHQTLEMLAGQLLSALAHVHASGFVHRDLKPANVLVRPAFGDALPAVKLTDFGLAAPLGHAHPPGVFSGSLPYVAPESLLGRPIDGRADLYGLGVLLYQLVTGELPMADEDPESILCWHVSGPPADPSRLCPTLPGRLSRFIARLTAKEPERRPASALDAMDQIGVPRLTLPSPNRSALGKGERASLRLALDAVHFGAVRALRMPELDDNTRAALRREAAVWAQVRGVRFHRLATHDAPLVAAGRLVLGLLAECGPGALASLKRHRLERHLQLAMLGGVPLLDPRAAAARGTDARALREAGRRVAGFLVHCAAVRSIVLWIEGQNPSEPLHLGLVEELDRAQRDATQAGRGGLLLVLATRSRQAHQAQDRRRSPTPSFAERRASYRAVAASSSAIAGCLARPAAVR